MKPGVWTDRRREIVKAAHVARRLYLAAGGDPNVNVTRFRVPRLEAASAHGLLHIGEYSAFEEGGVIYHRLKYGDDEFYVTRQLEVFEP